MKRIITLFLIVAVSSLTYAQEEAIVSVFQKDKTVVSVAREEVDSISYSRIDKNGILHESFVSQLIHTKDSTHRWLLNEVDSVTFEWMPDGEVTHDQVPRPRVWSRDANDITCNGATLRGKLRGADASAVSKLGFYVSQDYHEGRFGGTYYEASIDNSRWGTFSLPISGLVAAEKYYFRAVAVYKGRDFQGLVNSFRTEGVSVTTMSAEIKTPFSVMVGGSTDACHSDGMVCGFYYNTTGNPNADNAESVSAENTDNTFKRLIDDLRPATTYYLRAYVILDGKIFMGDVIKFKTPEFLITTLEAEPGSFTAKLKGCYMPESIEVDSVGFYYFTSPAIEAFPDFSNAISVSCTKALPSFEYQLTGLEPRVGRGDNPDDNYYVRAYADKNGERYVSTDFVRFSTEGIKLLTMSDTIIGGKPWFRGAIFYEGELDDADRRGGFLYRTTSNGITSDWEPPLLSSLSQLGNGDIFGVSPEALTPGCIVDYMTIYYSVTNRNLAYGDVYSFTYGDVSVTTLDPIVEGNGATLLGLVGGIDFSSDTIITAGFCLSLTQDFSGQESRVYTFVSDDLDTSTGVFTSFVDHIPHSTDIYYYAFVEVNGHIYKSDIRTLRIEPPICPDDNHPHMVDLGLPSGIKWACCNIGANTPEQSGGYYAWGETSTKRVYNWSTYKYGNSIFDCIDIGSDISGTSYDAATANWGYPWQMPSREQQDELMSNCSYQWISNNGVNGALLTGLNGNKLFFPAAGFRTEDYCSNEGYYGYYPSSSVNPWDDYLSDGLFFASDGRLKCQNGREGGYCVRAVCVPEQSPKVSVLTSLASDISVSSATISGKILEYSNSTLNWKVGFVCWLDEDTDTEYLKEVGTLSDYIDGFEYNLTGLKPGQDYFYRAYIRDNDKFYYGETKQFTTSLPSADYSVYDSNNLHYYLYSGDKTATLVESWNYDLKEIAVFDSIAYNGVVYAVKRIAQHAFIGCTELAEVSIPDGVTSIGDGAFYGCTSLVSVKLPAKLKSINSNLFAGCDHLESIVIPDRVVSIKSGAFEECASINDLFIPKSVRVIEIGAFDFCENLSSISVSEDNSVYDSRNNCNAIIATETNKLVLGCGSTHIPDNVNEIEGYAFYGNKGLVSIKIPANVKDIGIRAFSDCTNLISVLIEGQISEFRDYIFSDCTSLKTITLPSTLTKMSSLSGCKNITDLYCYAAEVPNAYSYYFSDFAEKATLHVPASALTDYKNSYAWGRFKNIVAIE